MTTENDKLPEYRPSETGEGFDLEEFVAKFRLANKYNLPNTSEALDNFVFEGLVENFPEKSVELYQLLTEDVSSEIRRVAAIGIHTIYEIDREKVGAMWRQLLSDEEYVAAEALDTANTAVEDGEISIDEWVGLVNCYEEIHPDREDVSGE